MACPFASRESNGPITKWSVRFGAHESLWEARKRKERTFPELCQGNGCARLVKSVAGVEETKTCLWSLACPKAVSVATDVRKCSSRWVQEMDLAPRRSPGVGDQVPSVNELMPGFWCSALAPVRIEWTHRSPSLL